MAVFNFNRLFLFAGTLLLCTAGYYEASSNKGSRSFAPLFQVEQDTIRSDTSRKDSANRKYEPSFKPTYNPKDRFGDPFIHDQSPSPLLLKDPSSLEMDVEIDTGMNYTIYEKIGDINYRPTSTMTFEEFSRLQEEKMIRNYWKTRSLGLDGESAVSGRRLIPPIYVSPFFDRIFGGSYVDIRPNGFVNLDFGGRWDRVDNPSIPVRQQRNGGFEFDQQISMNVTGKIGEKLSVLANFDNNNSFDFENDLKVEYTGFDEEIIKKIEFGNVSMPLNNSLITGAQNLFGVKTQLQFGRLYVTGIASTQRGKSDVIEIDAGLQGSEFEIRASEYDENRHFFLGHFFRENYGVNQGQWLSRIPHVSSGVNITRVEVYVINNNNNTTTIRNIIGFMDLGESDVIFNDENIQPNGSNQPNSNGANNLFSRLLNDSQLRNADQVDGALQNQYGMVKGRDYEKIPARKLEPTEYTFNSALGYISLSRKLQSDEALAVAYEYTYNGQRFKVGELTEDYANRPENEVIFLKLLRPGKINTDIPTWDLMMKNIYNLNASQVTSEGFELRIIYRDDNTGIDNPSLHEGVHTKDVPLVQIMGVDRLNSSLDVPADGNFDFIEGVTILPENGQIVFPVTEPFGDHLRSYFEDNEINLINKYVYDTLYSTTKSDAELISSKNKFYIRGRFQSGSAREIMLPGISIAENSVRITAGNTPLTEGVDYRVDYNLGKVTLLNEGVLNSGKKIIINYEKADLFSFQTRSLLGSRLDYQVNDDFNIGATMLYVNERPLMSRINIGDEPTRNFKYGFDINYRTESRFLTKMVDFLPFVSTKEPSTITVNAEFAQIRPGTSNIVGGEGTSYIDDFEGTLIPFNIGNDPNSWHLAATPETEDNRFIVGPNMHGNLGVGYKRARMAWYIIDPVFYRRGGRLKPPNITDEDMDNRYVQGFAPQDLWPNKSEDEIILNERIFDVAYFPAERGQFNYNPNLDFSREEPLLPDPASNWAGITRSIASDVDFDKNNIEFIEFWMMDPFAEGPEGRVLDGIFNENNTTGGYLYFNLGSVSEDVIKDNRHGFENGLPAESPPDLSKVTETEWGKVTTQQYLTNAFDNSPQARENQDVGLDGLKNEEEKNFEGYPEPIRNLDDPSADDFQHYLSEEFDRADAKVLERYKRYNGTDGNSPVSGSRGNYNLPNNEDLNKDNTISDVEEYYEYRLNLRPNTLDIGSNHIVDKVNAKGVDWYLVRIPIREPSRVHGDIRGFKSIRFIRMYMTGFSQPVVIRMAKLQLIGSQWRKFQDNVDDGSFRPAPESNPDNMSVSVVNREENGSAGDDSKIPYVTPPGVKLDRDITSAVTKYHNEQAIQLCVEDLADRDGRAVFKNVNYDLVNYGKVKMFIHAQSPNADDGELTAFLRLGTDFTENYYEIEVPLNITRDGAVDPAEIWPRENEIDIALDVLNALKVERNRAVGRYSSQNPNDGLQAIYSKTEGRYTLSVRGNPDLSDIQSLMIGVKNPHQGQGDDQLPKTACIWANELRVSDFDTNPGWAANARVNTKLADFANVTASTRHTSFGFGGVQQRISERSREEIQEFDVSANVNVEKMLPGNTGLKVPLYVSYETSRITPQYDPRDPDVKLSASLLSFETEEQREQYRRIVQDRAVRRSINFSNVRKEKVREDAKNHIYDIENFSVSYAYSDVEMSGFERESYLFRSYTANLTYNYNPDPSFIEPFKNIGFLKSPWLALIRDFNFSLMPNALSFRADLDRKFKRIQLRNSELTTDGIAPTFEKYFYFNRNYNMRWNLTKSLALDYTARAHAIIDEPQGDITSETRSEIVDNIMKLGRMKNFSQMASANYRLPLDKIPFTDWISADLQYSAGYTWQGESITDFSSLGPLNPTDSLDSLNFSSSFGNLIQNNRERQVSGKFDMTRLYNKVKFLKDINTPSRRARPSAQPDTASGSDAKALKAFLRFLMALRSVNVTYGISEGTILPGYNKTPFLFGLDSAFSAPGVNFILGSQDPSIRETAYREQWLVQNPSLTTPFSQVRSEDLNVRGTLEPFRDLRIQVNFTKRKAENYQEIFRQVAGNEEYLFESLTPFRSGSYSISFLPIKTAFIADLNNNMSPVFEDFNEYREVIRQRLNRQVSGGEYRPKDQDVLIPAFIAAYTGQDPSAVSLSPFPRFPMPNWNVDFRGLTNIPALKEIFSSISISHSYSSEFRVSGFQSSGDYDSAAVGALIDLRNPVEDYPVGAVDENNQIVPLYVVNSVMITERFSPLIGVNFTTQNRLQARIEYRKERNIALETMNGFVTEVKNNDIAFSFGFTKAGMKLPFKAQGETIVLDNDLTFKCDFAVRDTRTLQRKLVEVDSTNQIRTDNVITSGNISFQLRPTVSYVLNERLNLSAYFERNINEPRISTSYPRKTTAFGVQVRFSLAQ